LVLAKVVRLAAQWERGSSRPLEPNDLVARGPDLWLVTHPVFTSRAAYYQGKPSFKARRFNKRKDSFNQHPNTLMFDAADGVKIKPAWLMEMDSTLAGRLQGIQLNRVQ
jgi:hypothetical protein